MRDQNRRILIHKLKKKKNSMTKNFNSLMSKDTPVNFRAGNLGHLNVWDGKKLSFGQGKSSACDTDKQNKLKGQVT